MIAFEDIMVDFLTRIQLQSFYYAFIQIVSF